MAKMGSFSALEMKQLQKQLEKIRKDDADAFVENCAKELAARLLAKVIKDTPVGEYSNGSGKKGGTLRRGWTGEKRMAAAGYVQSLKIHHFDGVYVIEITNPVEYASYVEFGHRTVNHKGWVLGHFMMTVSEQQIQNIAPKVLERKVRKFLKEYLK